MHLHKPCCSTPRPRNSCWSTLQPAYISAQPLDAVHIDCPGRRNSRRSPTWSHIASGTQTDRHRTDRVCTKDRQPFHPAWECTFPSCPSGCRHHTCRRSLCCSRTHPRRSHSRTHAPRHKASLCFEQPRTGPRHSAHPSDTGHPCCRPSHRCRSCRIRTRHTRDLPFPRRQGCRCLPSRCMSGRGRHSSCCSRSRPHTGR